MPQPLARRAGASSRRDATPEANVRPWAAIPDAWTVETVAYDNEGAHVSMTVFSGPDAKVRAEEYARWKYHA